MIILLITFLMSYVYITYKIYDKNNYSNAKNNYFNKENVFFNMKKTIDGKKSTLNSWNHYEKNKINNNYIIKNFNLCRKYPSILKNSDKKYSEECEKIREIKKIYEYEFPKNHYQDYIKPSIKLDNRIANSVLYFR